MGHHHSLKRKYHYDNHDDFGVYGTASPPYKKLNSQYFKKKEEDEKKSFCISIKQELKDELRDLLPDFKDLESYPGPSPDDFSSTGQDIFITDGMRARVMAIERLRKVFEAEIEKCKDEAAATAATYDSDIASMQRSMKTTVVTSLRRKYIEKAERARADKKVAMINHRLGLAGLQEQVGTLLTRMHTQAQDMRSVLGRVHPWPELNKLKRDLMAMRERVREMDVSMLGGDDAYPD